MALTLGATVIVAAVWLVVNVFPVLVLVFGAILLAAGLEPMISVSAGWRAFS